MNLLEAIILGIIQGITEFLPVSSSGHLVLFQHLFGFQNLDQYVLFNVVCHLGTLLAIFFIFFEPIKESLTKNRKLFLQVAVATLPLFPMVIFIKPIKEVFDHPEYLGFFFIITSLLLFIGIYWGSEKSDRKKNGLKDSVFIGLFQVVALLPGISRSGSTITGARLFGWTRQEAVTFSFLLAIPAILGATAVESFQIIKNQGPMPSVSLISYLAGFTTSFGVGFASLKWLISLAIKDKFHYFVWYCLFIGIVSLIIFNFA